MDGFNINKIFLGLANPEIFFKKLKMPEQNKIQSFAPEVNASLTGSKPQQNQVVQNTNTVENLAQQLQMNVIANTDRSVFIKNLLGLPQNLSEVLVALQNPENPISGGTLGLPIVDGEILENKNALASIFNEDELKPVLNPELLALHNVQAKNMQQQLPKDTVALFFSGMISMADVSKLILQNGKQAVASLIIAMATASKQGVKNEQIQETLSVVNSCISMAESNTPAQSLKSLMMLYLPWLPLNDGVGFDLEITPKEEESDSNDSKLTVLIQTKNFGNLKGEFTLTTSNSVEILIICSENFPKKMLQKSLQDESTTHAMNTNIDIEEVTPINKEINDVHETKVNLSATNEMNPYLLLMAHSFIRNTILIDNNASLNAA